MEKTQRYASRRLNGSVVHIAGQIKTELEPGVVEKLQWKTLAVFRKTTCLFYFLWEVAETLKFYKSKYFAVVLFLTLGLFLSQDWILLCQSKLHNVFICLRVDQ